jgi:glycosyltransferase involved in cell wall biosynthesis
MVKIGFETAITPQADVPPREPVCLHVSSFTQPRKNVVRLIEACGLAGIELWIAGSPGNPQDYAAIRGKAAGRAVKFLGFQSDEQLARLMERARIFALPSLCEGVGLAALEAAALGCEIVVTKRGGPPDYFGPKAHYVDPYDMQSIVAALQAAARGQGQPGLGAEIRHDFSASASVDALEKCYQDLLD